MKPPKDAIRFLRTLDPKAKRFTFQTFDDSKKKRPGLARVLHGSLDQHHETLARLSAKGAGIFVTINETDGKGREAENITRVRAVFADLDGAPLDPVRKSKPHLIVESSPGKWHVYWLVNDMKLDQFRPVQKGLSERFDSDPKVHDLPRVMRLPGYPHQKGTPFTTRVESISDGAPYKAARFAKIAVKEAEHIANGELTADIDRVRCAVAILPNQYQEWGDWKAVLMAIHAATSGSEEGFEIADEWSQKWGDYNPDRTRLEWERITRSPPKHKGAGSLFWMAKQIDPNWDKTLIINRETPAKSAALFNDRSERRLLHHASTFYEWQGTYYRELHDDDVNKRLSTFFKSAKQYAKNTTLVPFNAKRRDFDEIKHALKNLVHIDSRFIPPVWLEGKHSSEPLIACANGLLRLSDGKLLPHSSDYFNTSAVDFAYDPKAPTPKRFLAFLKSIWGDDQETIDALQDMFGYVISGDRRLQKMFLFVGPNRSGKGTLGRLLRKLVGPGGHAAPTLAGLAKDATLSALINKTLAVVPDARIGRNAHTTLEHLLAISGGDSLTFDRKYKDAWTGVLLICFVILTNELPQFMDNSGALASRFIIFKFVNSFFGKEDPELYEKLAAEITGIFNWAIEGWRRLKRRGYLIQPASGKETAKLLEAVTSPISSFLAECCDVDDEFGIFEVEVDQLYTTYREWCESQGRDRIATKTVFGRDLHAALPNIRTSQTRVKGERVRVYTGIRLRPRS